MATITKVRRGMFIIKWNLTFLGDDYKTSVLDISQIVPKYRCRLLYYIENEQKHALKMHFINESRGYIPDEIECVWATKNDVERKMKKEQVDQTDEAKRCLLSALWKQPKLSKCDSDCERYKKAKFDIVILLKSFSDNVTQITKRLTSVHEAIKQIRENQDLTDVKFLCENETITGHSTILSAGSPVLAAMFRHDFQEKQQMVVEITDITANVFKQLLQFLYIQDVDFQKVDDVDQLFFAADKYNVDLLKEECEIHLSENLTLENYAHYLVLGHLHKAPKLVESSLEFMAFNAKEVSSRGDEWLGIIKNYPELAFEATKRMVAGY